MNRSPRLVGFVVIGSLGLAGLTWARADAPKAPGQGRLTESFCRASATRKAAAAAMNKQGVTSSKVKFLRFEYLERVRKDEFCAYTAVLAWRRDPLRGLPAARRTVQVQAYRLAELADRRRSRSGGVVRALGSRTSVNSAAAFKPPTARRARPQSDAASSQAPRSRSGWRRTA